jgi:hypothetical protein
MRMAKSRSQTTRQDWWISGDERHHFGPVCNEVADPHDRVRPAYADRLFVDLAAIAKGSAVRGVGSDAR